MPAVLQKLLDVLGDQFRRLDFCERSSRFLRGRLLCGAFRSFLRPFRFFCGERGQPLSREGSGWPCKPGIEVGRKAQGIFKIRLGFRQIA
jgi:hypothetical protein